MKYDIYVTKNTSTYQRDGNGLVFMESNRNPGYFTFAMSHDNYYLMTFGGVYILSDQGLVSDYIPLKSIEGMYKL